MTPSEFRSVLRRDLRKLRSRVKKAARKTAKQATRIIAKNVPVAFGELKDSLVGEPRAGNDLVAVTAARAPHAAAVEVGSRPHLVPIDELIAWVKLRGAQGLTATGRIRTNRWNPRGTTTRAHAIRVAQQLRAQESGGALGTDAPEQIARAIQAAILRKGTKPHWYVAKSMPEILTLLDDNINAALASPD